MVFYEVLVNSNSKDMCYKRHIKDIVADVIEIVEQIVYDKFQWNLTSYSCRGILLP